MAFIQQWWETGTVPSTLTSDGKLYLPYIPQRDEKGNFIRSEPVPEGDLIDLLNPDGSFNSDFDNVYDFLHNDVSLQILDLQDLFLKFNDCTDFGTPDQKCTRKVLDFQKEYRLAKGNDYDYKTNIKNLWAALNGFRSDLTTFAAFVED